MLSPLMILAICQKVELHLTSVYCASEISLHLMFFGATFGALFTFKQVSTYFTGIVPDSFLSNFVRFSVLVKAGQSRKCHWTQGAIVWLDIIVLVRLVSFQVSDCITLVVAHITGEIFQFQVRSIYMFFQP